MSTLPRTERGPREHQTVKVAPPHQEMPDVPRHRPSAVTPCKKYLKGGASLRATIAQGCQVDVPTESISFRILFRGHHPSCAP